MIQIIKGFPGGTGGKESACNVETRAVFLPYLFCQGIFATQGSNPHLLHLKLDFFFFSPLHHQGIKEKLKETNSQKVCNLLVQL